MILLILKILFAIDCIALIIIIIMQKDRDYELYTVGSININHTYWEKNKGRTLGGNIVKITNILCVLFFILAGIINYKLF